MRKKLTTNAGCPVVDNQNVMTAGPRGPQLLQDVWFLEKLAHFDREVIPERRMHAKGSGAVRPDQDGRTPRITGITAKIRTTSRNPARCSA
jgi:hypothetical protein